MFLNIRWCEFFPPTICERKNHFLKTQEKVLSSSLIVKYLYQVTFYIYTTYCTNDHLCHYNKSSIKALKKTSFIGGCRINAF